MAYKKILYVFFLFTCFMSKSYAFTCIVQGKTLSGNGSYTASVYVNLTPKVESGQNLVIDLSESISCNNDDPDHYLDPIRIASSSGYANVLKAFTGSISYYGQSYSFPLQSATAYVNNLNKNPSPWKVILYLTPIANSAMTGVVIPKNTLFATVVLEKGPSASQRIYWNLYANNDVVVPTGTCAVSSNNITVPLPNYSGDSVGTTNVGLSVHCYQGSKPLALTYFISGTTTNSNGTIFKNMSDSSPAAGIGVSIKNKGGLLAANNTVSLGYVSSTDVDLGLTAEYARTSGQVTAGNVKSLITVTFAYQ
ncbi:fimbrial protein [Rosenbergiella australiborealis]|uniref:fimbrial protein n=1 Tax=Rosenbergiella australiborealis TaxID=1544696 RepID=UPI001F4E4506|nr:fimbrial protein [Rosenbergiella australiborealis]